ncbi:MAG: class I SAM-dependent methyltransferase [Gammaproteobacteria bacterium]|jgi:SAM-dependent methyltransferase
MSEDLTKQESHFAFGENWAAYSEKIGETEINEAVAGLSRLLGGERLDGKRFLDIGCGSGLHSLAALKLGAAEVVAVDIDPASVATTRAVLEHRFPSGNYTVEQHSVFELDPASQGTFDVVYSWGVLHHTGDMDRAMRLAASLVADSGIFIFALYRKTWMCGSWKIEKRWYARASSKAQSRARSVYTFFVRLGLLLMGRDFKRFVREYRGKRGMDYYHDVHDWMGGWPYESISPREVDSFMHKLGFSRVRSFVRPGNILGRRHGIFGSGCDEYVYRHDDNG